MVVVFGKTVDEITMVVDLNLVWTFRVEEDRVKFLKNDSTWVKPNLEGIGTPQEVMKYISYSLTNEAKVCFVIADTIKAFREEFNGERERNNLLRKERRLRNALVALNKED